MHIFVSWSGEPAQALAAFLQTWLRQVIQELDPFMSTNSIAKGARWSPEIAKRLEGTSEAVVCVTSENQDAPWLNFEAGALAKATGSHVRPLLIDLAESDVTGPLSEFQLTSATDKEDVRRLINSINENCDRTLPNEILNATFEREWPALKEKVNDVIKMLGGKSNAKRRKREDPDLLAEVLGRVRAVERLGQQQVYISERMYDQMMRRFPADPVVIGERRRRLAELRAGAETLTLPELRERYEMLRQMLGKAVRMILIDGRLASGKLVSVENDTPDSTVVLEVGSDGEVELIPLAMIRRVTRVTRSSRGDAGTERPEPE